jgi:DNA-binding NarL/FixJ family response regulator
MEQRILLVVADPVVSSAIQGALSDAKGGPFILEWVSKLSEGLACMKEQVITAVFLDLFLPDSHGIDTFSQFSLTSPYVPIIVLSTLADENTAKEAVNRGAYDYLLKNRLDGYSLVRALHSVIARKAAEDALFLEKERAVLPPAKTRHLH